MSLFGIGYIRTNVASVLCNTGISWLSGLGFVLTFGALIVSPWIGVSFCWKHDQWGSALPSLVNHKKSVEHFARRKNAWILLEIEQFTVL